MEYFLGVILENKKRFFLTPLHRKDVFFNLEICHKQYKSGDVLVFTHKNQDVKIKEKIGNIQDPDIFYKITIFRHDLPHIFSEDVQCEGVHLTVPEANEKRLDLRSLSFVTIDGEDAKDFDDAVFVEKAEHGLWHVYIAIADVGHYVQPFSALDREALKRGNSVYLPNYVIPMLPEVLSNELCSLKPQVDRAVLVVKITLLPDGKVDNFRFHKALIRSKARLTYTMVQEVLDGKWNKKTEALKNEIQDLYEVYSILKKKSKQRGTIDLHTPEYVIHFKNQRPASIQQKSSMQSQQIIEELMILANTCAGKILSQNKKDTIYRVHPLPDDQRFVSLKESLKYFAVPFPENQGASPHFFNKVLKNFQNNPCFNFIQDLVLRTQAQAYYSPKNIGHFGLSLHHYCHFTSPIRRYADLIVHRCLTEALDLDGENKVTEYALNDISEHISKTERIAMKAERETFERLAFLLLQEKEGKIFKGRISGVVSHGLFIRLEDYGVEGYLSVSELKDDYYIFDEKFHRFSGRRKKNIYQLGQEVEVYLLESNFLLSQLKLEIIVPKKAQRKPEIKPIDKTKKRRRRRK